MYQKQLCKIMLVMLVAVGSPLAVLSTTVNAAPPDTRVTSSVIGNGTITPSGEQLVAKNSMVSFNLAPDPHYYFVNVTGSCPAGTVEDNGDGTWKYTTGSIKSDCTVIANFSPDQNNLLTVTKVGTGTGTVTSNPAGIDCGADCTENYNYGTVVTLTANPDTDTFFEGWSGDADCSDGSVTMDMVKNCTATFTRQYSITASASPVAGGGVSCSPNPVHSGLTSTCTISTNPHYTIDNVTGTCGGTLSVSGETYTTNAITSECTVIANFAIDQHNLTVTKAGTGTGTVTSSPAGIDCGADCTENYNYGTEVTLTALATYNSTFIGWSGDGCTGIDGCTVNMDQVREITATFKSRFPWHMFIRAKQNNAQP